MSLLKYGALAAAILVVAFASYSAVNASPEPATAPVCCCGPDCQCESCDCTCLTDDCDCESCCCKGGAPAACDCCKE